MADELNDKQKLFCWEYAKCYNATKAYMRVYGCAYDSARALASKLMKKPEVRKEIKQARKDLSDGAPPDKNDIFQMYVDIAFADVTDYLDFGTEEKTFVDETGEHTEVVNYIRLKNAQDIDGRIITEIKQGRDGIGIKLADKMQALRWLADRIDGLLTEEQETKLDKVRAEVEKMKSNEPDEDEQVVIVNDLP